MENCSLCRFNKLCNSLPGFCFMLLYAGIAVLVGFLGYLFITQELMT